MKRTMKKAILLLFFVLNTFFIKAQTLPKSFDTVRFLEHKNDSLYFENACLHAQNATAERVNSWLLGICVLALGISWAAHKKNEIVNYLDKI